MFFIPSESLIFFFFYFFPQLEKEALVKGIPVGQTLDIDIPPPRPKRKPSNPYPRKTPISKLGANDGKVLTLVSSSQRKQILDLEKEPLNEVCCTLLSSSNELMFIDISLF